MRYFGYDAVGNRLLQLDELGNPSYFAYDGLRRVTQATDALQKHTYFEYDARSSLTKRIAPTAVGEITYMAYDAANRLETQSFEKLGGGADAPIYFSYDQVGNQTLVEDDSGADTVQEWDKLNRLTKKVTVAGPVYYEYDASSIKRLVKNPSLDKTSLVYSQETGWLDQVVVSASSGVRRHYYHYDAAGLPEKKILQDNKVMSYYVWDDAGRLETLANLDDGASVLSYFHYSRNANGAATQVRHESGGFSYFEFDALDRLTHEERVGSGSKDFDKDFGYDAASNRKEVHDGANGETIYYSYNAANLLTDTDQLPTADPVVFERVKARSHQFRVAWRAREAHQRFVLVQAPGAFQSRTTSDDLGSATHLSAVSWRNPRLSVADLPSSARKRPRSAWREAAYEPGTFWRKSRPL